MPNSKRQAVVCLKTADFLFVGKRCQFKFFFSLSATAIKQTSKIIQNSHDMRDVTHVYP